MSQAKYLRIAQEIERLIELGHFEEGAKIPAHRDLAQQFDTTPVTVAKACGLLAEKGLIEAFNGRGSFVRRTSNLKQAIHSPDRSNEWNFSILQPCLHQHLGDLYSELRDIGQPPFDEALFGYSEDSGLRRHKEAGRMWMKRYGMPVETPDQVVLTNGAQNALSALIELYTQPGDCVAVEALTYPGILSILHFLRRRPVAVALDREGMIPASLDRICQEYRPTMVIALPSHQNPTGATMPPERRDSIAEVIRQRALWLVEDDIYGFLNPGPITSIAARVPERAFYVSSLSKAISPGMRCGYVKAPEKQAQRLSAFVRSTLWLAPPLLFEMASRLIRSEKAFELADRQRAIARERQQLAHRILVDHTVKASDTSYHIWLELPEHWSADRFALAAREKHLHVTSGSFFCVSPPGINAVRLSLMAIADDAVLTDGLQAVADLLDQSDAIAGVC